MSGLIVLGDLPDRKKQHEGFREWSYFLGNVPDEE
jgi:hypothetical protein